MSLIGGDKLKKVLAQIGNTAKGSVSVGFLEGATYPDGQSVASVAFWNEYGHGGQFPAPPRPFFRNMIAEESGTWPGKLSSGLKHFDYDAQKTLGAIGEDIKGALQQSIVKLSAPELSKTTLMLRQTFGNNPHEIRASDVLKAQEDVAAGKPVSSNSKPLVWTGHMLNSIDYEVSE